uniref:Varicidin biosynthesis cluster MFS-type transporer n=1 Tax=Talaromyces variabilis TaxID=28576 RepID=PVHT_TALVA|nr:RecName: Full=Varicidin biosynthesis cluster MFS-type transporer [Talaromyces variabilis]AZZ09609.1 major facilitator superfamily ORF1 [Talaromyces variabilis]
MTTSTSKNAISKSSQEDLCSDTKDKGSSGGGNEANAEASKAIQGFRLVLLFVGLALSVFCLSLVCISEFISTFLFTRTYPDVFGFGRIVQSWLRPFRELRPSLIPLTTWRGSAPLTCYPRVVFSFLLESCTRSSRYGACSLRRWVFSSWDHSSAHLAPSLLLPGLCPCIVAQSVFTDRATWRWCFWINLPLGGVTAVAVFLFVRLPSPQGGATTFLGLLQKLDALGTCILMPLIICLLLALQWGGTTYAWNSWRVVLCLVLFTVLLVAWLYVQYRQGDGGALPLRIVRQRSIRSAILFTFGINGSMFIIVYYVPIWFQAVKDVTAQQSGINFLACSGSMSVAAIIAGTLVSTGEEKQHQGQWRIFNYTTLVSIATGLIWRYNPATSTAYCRAGTLVMFGFGAGSGMQMPFIAAQTVLSASDISLGSSLIILIQTMGGAVFLAVSQNLFQSKLIGLLESHPYGVEPEFILDTGASGLRSAVQHKYGTKAVETVLQAYNTALRQCFLVCIVLACLTIIADAGMEWKNVRAGKKPAKAPDAHHESKTDIK